MYSTTIREEELKNKVAADFFEQFDTTPIIGNIDFCVAVSSEQGTLFNANADGYIESLLWAEAKRGRKNDQQIKEALVQLILTIGWARTFDNNLPPIFLGAFDAEKIAFLPYDKIMPVFSQNDFNWKVTPSNHESKEFLQLYTMVEQILDNEALLYRFTEDEKELKTFIHKNLRLGNTNINRVSVNKNNFVTIYNKWVQTVQPTISINWEGVRKFGILSGDFFLADLLSQENSTIIEKLFVLLKSNHYELDRKIDALGFEESKKVSFTDRQKAHKQFWQRYNRPPKEEYWNYIVERRDLLVPQDVRERKGSFFTPQRWVELSQQYIADVLGEDWQDEYYIWDCCAGTGNLLAGLTNKYNIWASTLDKADVEVMRERVANGANLLESHIFQFDFLNDDFSTLPAALQDIISNPVKRCKLVIYINPPYAEADNRKGSGRSGVAVSNLHIKYDEFMGYAKREMYIQFLTRIYCEINGCIIGNFSTLKTIVGPRTCDFRKKFQAKLLRLFIVPANTFDNVKGAFPIGFYIWDTNNKEIFSEINTQIYDAKGDLIQQKNIKSYDNVKLLNDWIKSYKANDKTEGSIATIIAVGSDFQNQQLVRIVEPYYKVPADNHHWQIIAENLIASCVYFSVRQCIEHTWINHEDRFLLPFEGLKESYAEAYDEMGTAIDPTMNCGVIDRDARPAHCATEGEMYRGAATTPSLTPQFIVGAETPADSHRAPWRTTLSQRYWYTDPGFQTDCLIYTLFHTKNRITASTGINHWIPFTEQEVNAKEKFASHFMSDFLQGKHRNTLAPKGTQQGDLFAQGEAASRRLPDCEDDSQAAGRRFSLTPVAQKVLDAGRELWRYYHEQAGQQTTQAAGRHFSLTQAAQYNPNASFYDIRLYFQGTDAKGKMNNKSEDEHYNTLLANLRAALKDLAKQIEPKVYQYGFLLGE